MTFSLHTTLAAVIVVSVSCSLAHAYNERTPYYKWSPQYLYRGPQPYVPGAIAQRVRFILRAKMLNPFFTFTRRKTLCYSFNGKAKHAIFALEYSTCDAIGSLSFFLGLTSIWIRVPFPRAIHHKSEILFYSFLLQTSRYYSSPIRGFEGSLAARNPGFRDERDDGFIKRVKIYFWD